MKIKKILIVIFVLLGYNTLLAQSSSGKVETTIDTYLYTTPTITQIGNAGDQLDGPTDLDFHPTRSRNQLWVINKRAIPSGGSVVIYNNVGTPSQTSQQRVDGNAWHFMSLPTGLAFSKNGNWASCTGAFDDNHKASPGNGTPFSGPALWSGDLSIFAKPSGGNGSHLDMCHVSPYSQGIASEKDNVFWVFDGYNKDIVRYDFVKDHGPGNSNHGDAIIHRYSDTKVAMDAANKVPSHLVVSDGWVYIVDNDHQRVFRIKLNSGTVGGKPIFGPFEYYAEYLNVTGYTWQNVVTTGLVEPAGIDVVGDRMIVSDYSTGQVIVYDISTIPAVELGRINTTASGIMGIKIGPKGRIWYVDFDANTVNLIEPGPLKVPDNKLSTMISMYPNPSNNMFTVDLGQIDNNVKVGS